MCRVSIARSALQTWSRRFGIRASGDVFRISHVQNSLLASPDLIRGLLHARVSPDLIRGLLHARVSPDLIRGLFCVWCLRMGDPGSALRLAGNSGGRQGVAGKFFAKSAKGGFAPLAAQADGRVTFVRETQLSKDSWQARGGAAGLIGSGGLTETPFLPS